MVARDPASASKAASAAVCAFRAAISREDRLRLVERLFAEPDPPPTTVGVAGWVKVHLKLIIVGGERTPAAGGGFGGFGGG
jgi:hypothetical protein